MDGNDGAIEIPAVEVKIEFPLAGKKQCGKGKLRYIDKRLPSKSGLRVYSGHGRARIARLLVNSFG